MARTKKSKPKPKPKSKSKSKKPAAAAKAATKQPASSSTATATDKVSSGSPATSIAAHNNTADAYASSASSYGAIDHTEHSVGGLKPGVSEEQQPLLPPAQTKNTMSISADRGKQVDTTAEGDGYFEYQGRCIDSSSNSSKAADKNGVISPCARCRRIISHEYKDSSSSLASSITKAETALVPKFIAAQIHERDLKEVSRRQGSKVASFYESQNELIAELLNVNQQHTDDVLELQSEQRRRKQRQVDMAVRVSVFVNVLVVLAQLYAAISSRSLSLFATMSEATMDLLSSIILLLASMAARRRDRFSLYPSGRFKLETIGVIVFAVLMGTFSVALLVESASALLSMNHGPNNLSVYDAVCVVAALLAKVALFGYCYTLREHHTTHVLMTDHRNDIFVNAFGLCMAIVGNRLMPWMDPLGSLVIALMILKSWVDEAWDQIKLIVGISADPHLLQVLTYTALTHDPRIEKVDRVVAYHSGAKLFVEVDIVMPPATPLVMLHDVAESLQEKYERMPDVGRCHVHVDYEVTHRSEHQNAEA